MKPKTIRRTSKTGSTKSNEITANGSSKSQNYLTSTTKAIVKGLACICDRWDEFWFSQRTHRDLARVRFSLGIAASVYALTWLPSLSQWIADDGLLSRSQVEFLIGRGIQDTGSEGRISPLFSLIPSSLVTSYVILAACGCFLAAMGMGGRVTVIIAWGLLLGIIHRVPMLQGPGDYLITGLFGYLVICPGKSIRNTTFSLTDDPSRSSWLCNLAFRLLQCHLFLWIAASLASQFGDPIWWNGNAPWWLTFSGNRSWISMDFWLKYPYLMNLATYSVQGLQLWILVSLLMPKWRISGIAAMIAFSILALVIANDWIYSLAILSCTTILIPTILIPGILFPRSATQAGNS